MTELERRRDDQLLQAFGRMEGKVDAMHEDVKELKTDHGVLADKVSSLERSRAWITGAWAAVAAGVGYLLKGGN